MKKIFDRFIRSTIEHKISERLAGRRFIERALEAAICPDCGEDLDWAFVSVNGLEYSRLICKECGFDELIKPDKEGVQMKPKYGIAFYNKYLVEEFVVYYTEEDFRKALLEILIESNKKGELNKLTTDELINFLDKEWNYVDGDEWRLVHIFEGNTAYRKKPEEEE